MRVVITATILSALSFSAYAEEKPPEATPAPTEWYLKVDQQMIGSIAACAQEMKKREADTFLFALDTQLKHQPEIISAIKAK